MIYQGHLEPLVFTIQCEEFNERTKQFESRDQVILNRSRLGMRWSNLYTFYVFENGGLYTESACIKLVKAFNKLEHPRDITNHISIARINRDDKDFSSMEIYATDAFADFLTAKLNGRSKAITIDFIYFRSKADSGKPAPGSAFAFKTKIDEIIKNATGETNPLTVNVYYSEYFQPHVFVEEITDKTEI